MPPATISNASDKKPQRLAHAVTRSTLATINCCSAACRAWAGSSMTMLSSRNPTRDFQIIRATNTVVTAPQAIQLAVRKEAPGIQHLLAGFSGEYMLKGRGRSQRGAGEPRAAAEAARNERRGPSPVEPTSSVCYAQGVDFIAN